MPKLQGTRNYSIDEQYRLLTLVAAQLSHQQDQWDAVAAAFNSHTDNSEKHRSRSSLKRKFVSLCQSSTKAQGCSTIEKLAAAIKVEIDTDGRRKLHSFFSDQLGNLQSPASNEDICSEGAPTADAWQPLQRVGLPVLPTSTGGHTSGHLNPERSLAKAAGIRPDLRHNARLSPAVFQVSAATQPDPEDPYCELIKLVVWFLWFQEREKEHRSKD